MKAPHETFSYVGRRFLRIAINPRSGKTLPCTVPTRIAGRYEVRDLLAHGGGGVVLEVYDERTNHPLLAKGVLEYHLQRYADKPDHDAAVQHVRRVRHRLQTERRILVQLRRRGANAIPHPNDYVYDWNPGLGERLLGSAGNSWCLNDPDLLRSEPYLLMQHVHGTSLQQLLKTQYATGMPVAAALQVMRQVVCVLGALHQPFSIEGRTWELIYQDLKPGNILLSGNLRATLVDFGGCQIMIDKTLVLQGAHTPGYCPPEQAKHGAPLGPWADVYCVGSTLYHMLSGVNPQKLIPGQHDPSADSQQRRADPAPPKRGSAVTRWDWEMLSRRCPDAVLRLLQRCLEPNPEQRFPNATALGNELASLEKTRAPHA